MTTARENQSKSGISAYSKENNRGPFPGGKGPMSSTCHPAALAPPLESLTALNGTASHSVVQVKIPGVLCRFFFFLSFRKIQTASDTNMRNKNTFLGEMWHIGKGFDVGAQRTQGPAPPLSLTSDMISGQLLALLNLFFHWENESPRT